MLIWFGVISLVMLQTELVKGIFFRKNLLIFSLCIGLTTNTEALPPRQGFELIISGGEERTRTADLHDVNVTI
jgi:hypothetical protein